MIILRIIGILCWIAIGLFNLFSSEIDWRQYFMIWFCYVSTLLLLALEVM